MQAERNRSGESWKLAPVSAFWSLRIRTLLLVLLAVVPALALMAHTARQQRQAAAQQMRVTTLRLARLVASDAQGKVEGARQFLSVLAQLPSVRNATPECSAILASLLHQHPGYANMGVVRPDGKIVCSALPLPDGVNVSDRTYFQRALETGTFSVGDYQTGRVTKVASINFGYPVFARGGRISAVVFAALRLDWVTQISAYRLPDDATLTFLDDKGMVLLRYPKSEEWVHKQVLDHPMAQRIITEGEGTAEMTDLDGTFRLIAFTPLRITGDRSKAYVAVGIPVDEVYGEINRIYTRNLLSMGLVAILALAAAWVGGNWFFLQQVQALIRTARKITRGDLTARTGLHYGHDELSRLTEAFDEMADSLEHLTGRNELILSSAGEGIYGVDAEGHTTFVNPAAARMLGYKPEELIGRPHHETFHHTRPDGSPYPLEACPVHAAYREGETHRGDDEVFWRKDGTSFPVDYVATPAREHGRVVGAVVTFKDIAQRKDSEREIERAHQEVVAAALEKKRFYRDVIRAVSKGKLNLVDPGDIKTEGRLVLEGVLESPADDRVARKQIRKVAEETGMSPDRARELVLAAGEAATNAVKHATQGRYSVYLAPDRVIVRVSDRGAGISTENLPATLLQPGFSTKVSMGMGYTLMLELADRVWLTTGPDGTTIQLEKWIQPSERPHTPLAAAMARF